VRFRLETVELPEDAEPEQRRRYGKDEPDQDQPAVIQSV